MDRVWKNRWIDILIFNFCVVALLGFTLRSKILFSLPFIDYNRLLDAHFHFAFSGWVTLALCIILIADVLPEDRNKKPIYKWLPVSVLCAAWLLLLTSPLPANSIGSGLCSVIFILITYIFSYVFIADLAQSTVSITIKLLAVSALVCLVLSSAGIFYLTYLFASKSLNTFAYRDALYTYLHLQYNGFFTLAVFAILFNRLWHKMPAAAKFKAHRFSVWLVVSTLPTLFLTYLWRDPNEIYRVIAIAGSITLLISFVSFVLLAFSMGEVYRAVHPLIRNIVFLALVSFLLKVILQSGTLFPAVGNAVFGDRPVIIGFLHLVFLGFVTLFLMAWFTQNGFLNIQSAFTRFALIAFTAVVILNEVVLMTQGLGAMFIKSSYIFPWLLWGISIGLFSGALLIGAARLRDKKSAH